MCTQKISTHLVGKDSERELPGAENAQELSNNISVGFEYDISLKADIRTLFLRCDVNREILVLLQKDRVSDRGGKKRKVREEKGVAAVGKAGEKETVL